MSMRYQYLDANKKITFKSEYVPCFQGVEHEYKKECKYFALMFPSQESAIKQVIQKKYLLFVKSLWDFDKYLTEIDWKNHRVLFDLDKVPGHKVFAIGTCVRYLEESSRLVFTFWKQLQDKKKFDLSPKEQFLFMHYLDHGHCNTNHTLYSVMFKNCQAYLDHKVVYLSGSSYNNATKPPHKDYDLPFSQFNKFREISLYKSYSPPPLVVATWEPYEKRSDDGSFMKYLLEHSKNEKFIKEYAAW